MVLIMSAVMKPTAVNSDHLETLLSVLRSLKNDGNIPAVDFCERLSHIQARVSTLRAIGRLDGMSFDRPLARKQASTDIPEGGLVASTTSEQPFQTPMSMDNGSGLCDSGIIDYENVDVLGNPLIGSFLDGNQVQWLDVLFAEDGTLKEFASDIEEPFLFR
jgi:hypothetical protein